MQRNTNAKTDRSRNAREKKKGPAILSVVFYAIVLAALILMHVGLKLEIEKLTKEKHNLEESLSDKKNINIALTVDIQKLQDEEKISQIAETRLGMMKNTESGSCIIVDKDQIDQLTEIINNKY